MVFLQEYLRYLTKKHDPSNKIETNELPAVIMTQNIFKTIEIQ